MNRFVIICTVIFMLLPLCGSSQIKNTRTNQLLPFKEKGDFVVNSGNFNHYPAGYGFIYHRAGKYALPFLTFRRDTTNPWMVILNGGPGRSNLRLSFEIDSLLNHYNILLPGYRGIDDRVIANVAEYADDSILHFVENHQQEFNTTHVANDLALIAGSLELKKLTILAHSYGTIVAKTLYNHHPAIIDTIFAFSPVSYKSPIPNPVKVQKIITFVADSLRVPQSIFTDTIQNWLHSPHKAELIMGMVSAMYNISDILTFFNALSNQNILRSDIIERGKRFKKKVWLIDFALKFCDVKAPANQYTDIYKSVAQVFYSQISQYSVNTGCMPAREIATYCPVQFFIPEFEIFYTMKCADSSVIECPCSHADLWRQAPQWLNRQK